MRARNLKNALRTGGVLLATGALLAGCQKTVQPQQTPVADPVVVALKQAVERIQTEHSVLASVERGLRPTQPLPAKPDHVKEFSQRITLRNWNGPADEALKIIAGLVGYSFDESGLRSPIKPVIMFDADNDEFYEVVSKIHDQSGSRFNIRIDVAGKRLTMVHLEG
jgi:hypothetical protein